ncbi:MAG: hypothetical protein LCI02_29425 [Proteobacteria bacterium]|nr:hypothetical protein [Pseudomonadota bacterium]
MAAWLRIPLATLIVAAAPAALAADGLLLERQMIWPRWQPRLALYEAPDIAPLQRAALVGDYDLGSLGLALPFASGRFRATSGLIFDLRNKPLGFAAPAWAALGAGDATPLSAPYIGLGYTGWVPKTGLSFSADLGLSADYPGGAWRFGRALFGNQGFDATLRDLRLQPRLQLGVQYTY